MARWGAVSRVGEAPVTGGEDKAGAADGQGAGEVDGICGAKRVRLGELAAVLLHGGGELNRGE